MNDNAASWKLTGMFMDFVQCPNPHCGEKWPITAVYGWKFCPICGQPVDGFHTESETEVENGKSDDFIMMMESVPKPKRRGKKK